jgi:hypothetical protein
MDTIVYIDGFNFYYGCIKGTPYHWLNLETMCQQLLSQNNITAIKYFTALVVGRPTDPDAPIRQQTYLRALGTLPKVEIIYGHFLSHIIWAPLAYPRPGAPTKVQVIKTEEKGSDVNIASHMLLDAFQGNFDVAAVITNDSDLAEPIRIATQVVGKTVGVLNPHHQHPSFTLQRYATFIKQIRNGVLSRSLFPPSLTDSNGTFHKPARW